MKFLLLLLFLKILFIHERHRERQRHRQREKRGPHKEPNVGLDPGTPGSCPEPKADAQPLSHPGIPLLGLNPTLLLSGLGRVIPTAPVSSLVPWGNSSISSREWLCWSTKLMPARCSQHCAWTTVSPSTG